MGNPVELRHLRGQTQLSQTVIDSLRLKSKILNNEYIDENTVPPQAQQFYKRECILNCLSNNIMMIHWKRRF